MSFIDRIKAYLNEENLPEETEAVTEEELEAAEPAVQTSTVEDSDEKADEESVLNKIKSFFDKLRSRRKEKETPEEEAVKKKESSSRKYFAENPELFMSDKENGTDPDRESVQDICEQLVDVTYHMEDMKREYKLVTSYLTDIQRIEELPVELARDINETAGRIEMLDKSRQTYLQSENLLSMEQYNQIASFENEANDVIKKLLEMEQRDSMLKNDMGHLEGEKQDLRFMRKEYEGDISRLRNTLITVMCFVLLAVGVLAGVSIKTGASVTVYALAVGAVALVIFAVCYSRYIQLKDDIKLADAKIRRAVSLSNKVKVKYINNTNTLDYIYHKYNVNSAKELEYLYSQYNTMVRDALKYSQANNDYRVYCDELIEKLSKIGVKDPLVWPKQIRAIVDRREMVEIKHGLNTRRQKIRDQLVAGEKIRENATTALHALIEENPAMESYIKELLASYNIKL